MEVSTSALRLAVTMCCAVSTFNILLFSLERHSCRYRMLMSNIEEKYKESREAPLYKATERLLWEVE
jgi:hypothetical protein